MSEISNSIEETQVNSPISLGRENESQVNWSFRGIYTRGENLLQILRNSLSELLSSYIDPLIKQWIKNFHLLGMISIGILKKIQSQNRIPVPRIVNGKILSQETREILAKGKESELLEDLISKNGNRFKAFLKLNPIGKIQYRFPDSNSIHPNPTPGKEEIERAPFSPMDTIPKTLLGVALNEEVRNCLKKGIETPLIEGFQSKKGKIFSAYLKMNLNGDLKFRFPERHFSPKQGNKSESIQKEDPPNDKENQPIQNETDKIKSDERMKTEKSTPAKVNPLVLEGKTETFPNSKSNSGNFKNYLPEHLYSDKSFPSKPQIISEMVILGKYLDQESIQILMEGKETPLLQNFRTPSGKIFDAYLKLEGKDSIRLRIPSRELDLKINMIPKIILGVTLSEQNKSLLRLGKETELITNFKIGDEKPFHAYLKKSQTGNLVLRTPAVKKHILLDSLIQHGL